VISPAGESQRHRESVMSQYHRELVMSQHHIEFVMSQRFHDLVMSQYRFCSSSVSLDVPAADRAGALRALCGGRCNGGGDGGGG
jgi:hypothetical protein